MEPQDLQPEGEFHHFQLISQDGDVPLSITVLLHLNTPARGSKPVAPIGHDDIIAFHDALRTFDGNFINAFQKHS